MPPLQPPFCALALVRCCWDPHPRAAAPRGCEFLGGQGILLVGCWEQACRSLRSVCLLCEENMPAMPFCACCSSLLLRSWLGWWSSTILRPQCLGKQSPPRQNRVRWVEVLLLALKAAAAPSSSSPEGRRMPRAGPAAHGLLALHLCSPWQ